MYNLDEDLSETKDLQKEDVKKFEDLKLKMSDYDKQMLDPLWTEGHTWDTIVWMIHEDLFLNREIRVKDPWQLKDYKENR